MLQNPTESLCNLYENGFEICGIFQETPKLKELFDKMGRKIPDFPLNGNFFRVRGFREQMLKDSHLRPFKYSGWKIPREFQPFFSVLNYKIDSLLYRIENYHTKTPFDDEILTIKSDKTDEELFNIQKRYLITGIRLIETLLTDDKEVEEILYDAWCVLGMFYILEGLSLASREVKIPDSDLCPKCLEPMEKQKDNRYSEICKKCQRDLKIQKQRERRGTQIIGERRCACGCGEIITGRPNKKYVNDTHGRRVQKR